MIFSGHADTGSAPRASFGGESGTGCASPPPPENCDPAYLDVCILPPPPDLDSGLGIFVGAVAFGGYMRLYGMPYIMPGKHKTTLLLDERVWHRFQEEVMRTEGPRATSAEVEKAITATDLAPILTAVATRYPSGDAGFPSVSEVERLRPTGRGDLTRLIREDRDDRDDRLLGLQRPSKTVQERSRK